MKKPSPWWASESIRCVGTGPVRTEALVNLPTPITATGVIVVRVTQGEDASSLEKGATQVSKVSNRQV